MHAGIWQMQRELWFLSTSFASICSSKTMLPSFNPSAVRVLYVLLWPRTLESEQLDSYGQWACTQWNDLRSQQNEKFICLPLYSWTPSKTVSLCWSWSWERNWKKTHCAVDHHCTSRYPCDRTPILHKATSTITEDQGTITGKKVRRMQNDVITYMDRCLINIGKIMLFATYNVFLIECNVLRLVSIFLKLSA